jgi:uncharacterized protein (TIGR02996 family)
MSDRDALIAAILANPDEDTPRLALADWLQENGEPERAEFIRVQVELARLRAAEEDLPENFGTTRTGRRGGWPYSYRPHWRDIRCLDLAYGYRPDALARLERRLGKGKIET